MCVLFFWVFQFLFWFVVVVLFCSRVVVGLGVVQVDGYLAEGNFVIFISVLFLLFIFLVLHLFRWFEGWSSFAARNWWAAIIFGLQFRVVGFLVCVLMVLVLELFWWFLFRRLFANLVQRYFGGGLVSVSAAGGWRDDFLVELCGGETQRIARNRTNSGGERLEGLFLVKFSDDQLTATIHVPFYPVFDKLPVVEAFVVEPVDAKLAVSKTRHFGTRIDIKRQNKNINNIQIAIIAETK
ncbi:MAG: hypothetical protein LBQ66_13725 [Planctomycetaceae bacterium]|nr:hypothetical protein [Planctomycetaceae bacterium]